MARVSSDSVWNVSEAIMMRFHNIRCKSNMLIRFVVIVVMVWWFGSVTRVCGNCVFDFLEIVVVRLYHIRGEHDMPVRLVMVVLLFALVLIFRVLLCFCQACI
jgi:hypothetical protein